MINQYVSSHHQDKHPKVLTYVKDIDGIYLYVSPSVLEDFNFVNPNEILGRSDLEFPEQKDNVYAWIEEDKRIIATGKSEYVINAVCRSGMTLWQRTYKSPLYGRSGKIQGVTGSSIYISRSSLIPLTKQQSACLKHLAMGKTHKQIGQTLGLAQKTVEHYLDAVKLKLNCKSRSELIVQAIERGLVGFV